MSLLVLLLRVVGGTLIGVLVLLCLTLGAVKNRSDRLLARAWLVAMLRSSLVFLRHLRPSLWTKNS
jgi:hypothetical protein